MPVAAFRTSWALIVNFSYSMFFSLFGEAFCKSRILKEAPVYFFAYLSKYEGGKKKARAVRLRRPDGRSAAKPRPVFQNLDLVRTAVTVLREQGPAAGQHNPHGIAHTFPL
jgi:hypothetical protein